MDRSQAAAQLGVSERATPDEVRAAFRQRARSVHPDFGGSSEELDRLTSARNLLIDPSTAPPPSAAPPTAASIRERQIKTSASKSDGPSLNSKLLRWLWLGIIAGATGLAIAVIGLLIYGALIGPSTSRPADSVIEECVLMSDTSAVPVVCNTAGALRVVERFAEGEGECGSNMTSLAVESDIWCLQPVGDS